MVTTVAYVAIMIRDDPDSIAKVKINVQSFTGQENPDVYVDWEEKCNQIFCIHDFSYAKRVKLSSVELSGYVQTWWNQI